MQGFKITSTIICEDVRKEINNKDILIGVFSGDVVVATFPAQLSFAFWMEVHADVGKYSPTFRIRLNNQQLTEIAAEFHQTLKGDTSIFLPSLQLIVDGACTLSLDYRDKDDAEWTTLKTKRIFKGQLPFALSPSTVPA